MKNLAEFQIIGRVGTIRQFENVTRVAVAANYRRKDANGEWIEEADWNEVTIFSENARKYIAEHIKAGDLVHTRGRIRQNTYSDKETGEDRYTVDLIANEFSRLCRKQAEGDDA